jgi:uncharacterized protein
MRIVSLLFFTALLYAQSPIGYYLGDLVIPTGKLRMGLTVKAGPNNTLTGELLSIDQGFSTLPINSLSVDGATLKFAITRVNASYEGTFSEDGQSLTGKFIQGIPLELNFKRVAELPRPSRPQEPKGTPPYAVEDVTFAGGAPEMTLAGTLTMPKGATGLPAVILISGSGPQNRDEELFAHKPFLIWADTLTRAGFAVLRYDDRGTAKSTGLFKGSTTQDFALDAQSAVQYLRDRKEIDPKRIFLIGHSEGGVIAPIVASEDDSIAGIILLAGTGVTGEAILKRQIPDLTKAAGGSESVAITQLAAVEKQAQVDPWMGYFWKYDPATALKKVKCPVLALNGERDLQVNAEVNLAAIEAALKAGGNKSYTIKTLPKLNHLFQTAETGSGQEYGKIEETVAPIALEEVTNWLKRASARK